jgi:MFS family permease
LSTSSKGRGAVVLLTLAYVCANVDRHVFSLLVEPIKTYLRVTDSAIGLIHGISFSLFGIAAMLPLARLVDRGNRPRIIFWCIAFWSVMTMSCGLAASWTQLLIARTGVAIGEAGLPPAAYSYLADAFDERRLPRANSIYLLAPFVGGGLAMLGGGGMYALISGWRLSGWPIFGGLEGWQLIFLIVGLPGFLIGVLILARMPEVGRRDIAGKAPFRDVFTFLRRIRFFFIPYTIGLALVCLIFQAQIAWLPAMLMRGHGLTTAEAGQLVGILYISAGIGGTLAGGWLVGRAPREALLHHAVRIMTVGSAAMLPLAALAPVVSSLAVATLLFGLVIFINSGIFAISLLPLQLPPPPHMRARVIALCSLITVTVSSGGGPLAVGMASDWLGTLPVALSLVSLATLAVAAPLLAFSLRHVPAQHVGTRAVPPAAEGGPQRLTSIPAE